MNSGIPHINYRPSGAADGLSNADKARLLAGESYWATANIKGEDWSSVIPSVTITDGPNGLRKQTESFDNLGLSASLPATCFPSACTSACTFDTYLLELEGRAIGEECRHENVGVVLGPAVNIKRHPLGGRNFEYFSEDPLLSGKLAAAFVRGVQSTGVGACLKHMAANSQELRRMTSDSIVDERTLNDIYLRTFEIAVRESGPKAVMPAYNLLNGTYCSENTELYEKLRDWGFDGTTISDWGGMDKSLPSIEAGLDLCMPGPRADHVKYAQHGVKNGTLSQEALNRGANNVAELALSFAQTSKDIPYECDYTEHLAISQLIAEAGTVLLKNNGVLPLDKEQSIAVIGAFAKEPRYQGSGSSKVTPIALDCAWEAFVEEGWKVTFAQGFDADTGDASKHQISEAEQLASGSDIAVVFAGLPDSYESEGFDRDNMWLPASMDALIDRVCSANSNTIVVISSGGCVQMPWLEKAAAVLTTHLAGCRSGHATLNLLSGVANPSGRLAESWPARVEDTALGNAFPVNAPVIPYIEGPFVGYRYYRSAQVPVAFPFGHGLSYTKFDYSNLKIAMQDDCYEATFDISNVGKCDGAEVVQIYVSAKDAAVPMPLEQLAAFKKVHVDSGKTAHVRIELDSEAFSYWDNRTHKRRIDAGTYEILVGASSEDIRLTKQIIIDIDSPFEVSPREPLQTERRAKLETYFKVQPHGFTEESFEQLYGAPIPKAPPTLPYTPNSRLADLDATPRGRVLLDLIEKRGRQMTAHDTVSHNMLEKTFGDMPIRSIMMGFIPYRVVLGLVDFLNRKPLKMLRDLLLPY